jgi:hypothetical protein
MKEGLFAEIVDMKKLDQTNESTLSTALLSEN